MILLSALLWAYLLCAHGAFWRSEPVLPPHAPRPDDLLPGHPLNITVVLPARNEAPHIAATLRALLAQTLPGTLRILLVDDNSTDDTALIAHAVAAADSRLRVLSGTPLPSGWTGKLWAVAQGLAQPEAAAADYILLTDADILHAPTHIASLANHAQRHHLALVSEMVHLRCDSFAERATLPAFVFFFQMLYPFRWVNDPARRTAAAAGGTMLVAAPALASIEGVSRMRAALIDDVALARELKSHGHPIWLGLSEQAASERRYLHLREVWDMIARTAYVQLRYTPILLLATCAGLALLYLVPVAATLARPGAPRWIGLACWAAMALAFQPTLRRYARSPLWGAALPAIALFYLLATLASALRFHTGQGGQWKDRTYPTTP